MIIVMQEHPDGRCETAVFRTEPQLPFPVNMIGRRLCASRAEARQWAYAAADWWRSQRESDVRPAVEMWTPDKKAGSSRYPAQRA